MNLVVILALCLGVMAAGAPSCLDENGRPVDSWVVLKAAESFDYYFMSGSTWRKSANSLDGTGGMVMRTAAQAYGGGVMMGMYNDEMQGMSVSGTRAHAKGVLVSDAKQGFWIVHSMPKWPKPALTSRTSGPGPFDSDKYAQSMMCITVSASTADSIASNLMIEDVFLTGKSTLKTSTSSFPNFSKWLAGGVDKSRSQVAAQIKSLGGKVFFQLAKSASWGHDIWDDLVAPYFKTPLQVETWRNGVGGRISSVCSSPAGPKKQPYNVMEVATVTMPDGTSWDGTSDHSKWAVSLKSGAGNVYCVGGMNRMCSQEKRGGAALCVKGDAQGWKAFSSIVTATETCWEYNPCKGRGLNSCYWC
jgi:deoxyribonuclease-2